MKTALLDSSVWISSFIKDVHEQKVKSIFDKLMMENAKIILPKIVYAEIMNNLIRVDHTCKLSRKAKENLLNNVKISVIDFKAEFWHKKIEYYAKSVRLKTMDLLILASAFEFNVNEFYTFDVKLMNAFNILKSRHDKKNN
ncbi:MAG: type II toxin-antitoxin system VapC family toxin [Candidatus Gracilibacteria bacterium]|jgi:predicted nucleic acid-binding protein